MSKEERHLQTKIRMFEDILLRTKNPSQAFLLSLKTERLLCLEKQLMNYSEMWLSLIMR